MALQTLVLSPKYQPRCQGGNRSIGRGCSRSTGFLDPTVWVSISSKISLALLKLLVLGLTYSKQSQYFLYSVEYRTYHQPCKCIILFPTRWIECHQIIYFVVNRATWAQVISRERYSAAQVGTQNPVLEQFSFYPSRLWSACYFCISRDAFI